MNTDGVILLRKTIAEAPDEQFYYRTYFIKRFQGNDALATLDFDRVPDPTCGTAGCVAGWACMLFAPNQPIDLEPRYDDRDGDVKPHPCDLATALLDLDERTAAQLFLRDYAHADKQDALDRLDHLIEYGNLWNYNFDLEWTRRRARRTAAAAAMESSPGT